MRATPSMPDSHTRDAINLVNTGKKNTARELSNALDLYANTLTVTEKSNIQETILGTIDGQIALLEQPYRDMRNKRGEKITAQDIDDIMPFVHLAMLRSLFVEIGNKDAAGSARLKQEIQKYETQIENTREEINTLSQELEQDSKATEKAITTLTQSPEYSALEAANQKVGENGGTLETWRAVKKLVESNNTEELQTTFEDERKKVQEIKDTIGDYITKISVLENYPTGENVQAVLGEISFLITSVQKTNSIVARQVVSELREFQKVLQSAATSPTVNTQEFMTLLMMGESMRTYVAAQEKALESAAKALESAGGNRKDLIKTIEQEIITVDGKTPEYAQKLTQAKINFDIKVMEIEPLTNKARNTAQKLGKYEGKETILQTTHAKMTREKEEIAENLKLNTLSQQNINVAKEELNTAQRIRINASNLIVRSGPSKSSDPILTPDKKSAIMLQTGDIVNPVLDVNGNIAVVQDGSREYTSVILTDGTIGWIALTDKIGNKFKQEYGDINLTESTLNTAQSYQLLTNGVRLRTGFSTRADIIDTLNNADIREIHLITNDNAGDNSPEGSDMTWKQVEVTYHNGSKKIGYIAEKYLTPRGD